MGLAWELLLNGSIVRAAYESYNVPFSFSGVSGYPIGFLLIVFLILLYLQNQDIAFNFLVTLVIFALLFVWIPVIIKGIVVVILILELTGVIYNWTVKER